MSTAEPATLDLERPARSGGRRRALAKLAAVGVLAAILATAQASRDEGGPKNPLRASVDAGMAADTGRNVFWLMVKARRRALVGEGGTPVSAPRPAQGYRDGRRQDISVVDLDAAAVEIRTAEAFLAMREAAAENGVDLWVLSGFRTREAQARLYRAWKKGRGNKAARPGRSNHQSGRALDLIVGADGTSDWLKLHASRFGFKRTVPSEPWHWEYVEAPRARGASSHRMARGKWAKSSGKKRGSSRARPRKRHHR